MTDIDKPYFRCFVCGIQLEDAIGDSDEDDRTSPVLNGTHWRTRGNYGSSIYDRPGPPLTKTVEELEIVICDWCVLERQKQIREYKGSQCNFPEFRSFGPGPKPIKKEGPMTTRRKIEMASDALMGKRPTLRAMIAEEGGNPSDIDGFLAAALKIPDSTWEDYAEIAGPDDGRPEKSD